MSRPRRRKHSVIAGIVAAGIVIILCVMVLRFGATMLPPPKLLKANYENADDEELIALDNEDAVSVASSRATGVLRL